jgi:hypothetical protein
MSPLPVFVSGPRDKKFILLCAQKASQAGTNIMAGQKLLHPVNIEILTTGANGVSNTILVPRGYLSQYSGYAVY